MPSHTLSERRKRQKRVQKSAKLGSGVRFDALKGALAASGTVKDPAALAASIGRKKLGKARFQRLALKGRKRRGAKT